MRTIYLRGYDSSGCDASLANPPVQLVDNTCLLSQIHAQIGKSADLKCSSAQRI